MKEIKFTVTDPLGIHARPAGILVKEAKKFSSKITVWKGDKSCYMRKLLALTGMAVKQGETINVQVEGDYYCITMIGSGGYGSNAGETYRCVYIGKIK